MPRGSTDALDSWLNSYVLAQDAELTHFLIKRLFQNLFILQKNIKYSDEQIREPKHTNANAVGKISQILGTPKTQAYNGSLMRWRWYL